MKNHIKRLQWQDSTGLWHLAKDRFRYNTVDVECGKIHFPLKSKNSCQLPTCEWCAKKLGKLVGNEKQGD